MTEQVSVPREIGAPADQVGVMVSDVRAGMEQTLERIAAVAESSSAPS